MDVIERLTLEAAGGDAALITEHVHRYDLAAEMCHGLRVVDLCCGSGYGAEILARKCPAVLGVDIDVATIDAAQAALGQADAIRFEVADAHAFLRRDLVGEYEAIVLFEGLEHLSHPADAISELRRLTQQGMKLVFSLPNSKGLDEENPFHVTKFGYEEAMDTLEGFGNATSLFQFLAEGSLIRRADADTNMDTQSVLAEHGEPEYANHFLGCVNFEPSVTDIFSSRMRLQIAPVYNRYLRGLEEANETLRRANARLARSRMGKANSAASSLLATLEREKSELATLQEQLDPKRALLDPVAAERQALVRRIEELHEQALLLDRELRAMVSTRVWRLAGRYWRLRDVIRGALRRRN
jgi:2-polyprenyl-3-methyl-5-hydroxy-6-metoxy-1,4-benzoquinol methylase